MENRCRGCGYATSDKSNFKRHLQRNPVHKAGTDEKKISSMYDCESGIKINTVNAAIEHCLEVGDGVQSRTTKDVTSI